MPHPRPRPATQPVPRPPPTPTPPPALRAPSNTTSSTAATSPTLSRLARRRAAQRWERACERPWLPPCPANAAAPGRGAVGRVCGACESALQLLAARVCARIGRAALRGHPRRRAVHARSAGRSEGGSWDGSREGTRGRQVARAAALGPRAAVACDVPPAARGNACGAAVVGRRTGLEALCVCYDLFWVCVRGARRRVCAVSVRSLTGNVGCLVSDRVILSGPSDPERTQDSSRA
eukprot:scaffold91333_cov64-Phaeocystis_antarctica.AAC.3